MSENSPSKMLKFRNLLWKLHYKLEKRNLHTSFNQLTDEPRYRAKILASLADHPEEKLAELAAKIVEQEIALGIHYELDEAPLPLELITQQGNPSPASATDNQQKSSSKLLTISLLILSLVILSYTISQFFLNTPANTPAPTSISISEVSENTPGPSITKENTASEPITSVDLSPTPVAPAPLKKELILRLHGSNTVGEKLAPSLISGYLNHLGAKDINVIKINDVEKTIEANLPEKGWVEIEIQAHGSSTSFADMDKGTADMGMASRRIKPQEVTLLYSRFGDLTSANSEHIIGLDGLAIIVNKANPINQLSSQELAGLFSGEITNWSQLGGKDLPVTIYSRDDKSGTWDTFKNLVLKKYKKKLSQTASRYESSSKLSDLVSEDIGAIGFIGLPYVRNAKLLAVADDSESQAIIPTLFTVGTEDYPLSRRLYFYTPEKQSHFMRQFIEFTQSNAGQEIVKNIGFISQNLYTLKPVIADNAPSLYKSITHDSQRLSLNFRFKSGSNELDNKSLRDIERLTQYIAAHPEKQISLLGFSDSIGESSYNINLSEQRARKVEEELQIRGIYPKTVKGLGEQMPIASNDNKMGRNKNRRVEIWIKG